MNIRKASESDLDILSRCDRHIRAENLREALSAGRIYIAEDEKNFAAGFGTVCFGITRRL